MYSWTIGQGKMARGTPEAARDGYPMIRVECDSQLTSIITRRLRSEGVAGDAVRID